MQMEPKRKLADLVEVRLTETGRFLVVLETLKRIGIPSNNGVLHQSCHVLHTNGRYFIVHFKELFALDGLDTTLQEADLARRNWIIQTLERWKLIEVVDTDRAKVLDPSPRVAGLKVIRHADTGKWRLEAKYTIRGKPKADGFPVSVGKGKGVPADRGKPNPGQPGIPV